MYLKRGDSTTLPRVILGDGRGAKFLPEILKNVEKKPRQVRNLPGRRFRAVAGFGAAAARSSRRVSVGGSFKIKAGCY
jgi:hypothetical protein